MSESRNHFVFELLVLLCCISFQNVCGIEVELRRHETGDYFENPYATSPKDVDFCHSANASPRRLKCPERRGPGKCRYCKCDKMKTFNETSSRCVSFQDFEQGCSTKLSGNSGKPLNLNKNRKKELQWHIDFNTTVKSVQINMNGMKDNFFKQIGEPKIRNGHWSVNIEWNKFPPKKYDGRVFKAQIVFDIHSNDEDGKWPDCFVFKSKGRKNVTIPDLTTKTSLSPTKTLPSPARKEESSEENNAMTVSLAVVGGLLLLFVVVLVVLLLRRRSARTSKDKKNTAMPSGDGNIKNSMAINSQPENIYAEADSSINYPENGGDNHEYDYPDGNYASLDMAKVESRPVYQSLINVERDVNKQIPSKSGEISREPFYHVLEELRKTETQEFPSRSGNENLGRVYSALEEENAPENYDRGVSEGTGGDIPERVYSVLETERNPPTSETF